MKIQRLNKINEEVESKRYWIFVSPSEYIQDFELEESYLFDNDEDAFNFLVNRMYKKYSKLDDFDLDDLDDLIVGAGKDVTDLYEVYKENMDSEIDNLLCTYIPISNNVKLKNWIGLRLSSKKYNL